MLSVAETVEPEVFTNTTVPPLSADGISTVTKPALEAVYVSPPLRPDLNGELPQDCDEILIKLNSIEDIDYSPVDWSVCDENLGLRFSVVPYYLIIVKGGIIPPKYITKLSP